MLAKVIAHAPDPRPLAKRMIAALDDFLLIGPAEQPAVFARAHGARLVRECAIDTQ